jgi:hypothetical protein
MARKRTVAVTGQYIENWDGDTEGITLFSTRGTAGKVTRPDPPVSKWDSQIKYAVPSYTPPSEDTRNRKRTLVSRGVGVMGGFRGAGYTQGVKSRYDGYMGWPVGNFEGRLNQSQFGNED